jgi:hypothetical protein
VQASNVATIPANYSAPSLNKEGYSLVLHRKTRKPNRYQSPEHTPAKSENCYAPNSADRKNNNNKKNYYRALDLEDDEDAIANSAKKAVTRQADRTEPREEKTISRIDGYQRNVTEQRTDTEDCSVCTAGDVHRSSRSSTSTREKAPSAVNRDVHTASNKGDAKFERASLQTSSKKHRANTYISQYHESHGKPLRDNRRDLAGIEPTTTAIDIGGGLGIYIAVPEANENPHGRYQQQHYDTGGLTEETKEIDRATERGKLIFEDKQKSTPISIPAGRKNSTRRSIPRTEQEKSTLQGAEDELTIQELGQGYIPTEESISELNKKQTRGVHRNCPFSNNNCSVGNRYGPCTARTQKAKGANEGITDSTSTEEAGILVPKLTELGTTEQRESKDTQTTDSDLSTKQQDKTTTEKPGTIVKIRYVPSRHCSKPSDVGTIRWTRKDARKATTSHEYKEVISTGRLDNQTRSDKTTGIHGKHATVALRTGRKREERIVDSQTAASQHDPNRLVQCVEDLDNAYLSTNTTSGLQNPLHSNNQKIETNLTPNKNQRPFSTTVPSINGLRKVNGDFTRTTTILTVLQPKNQWKTRNGNSNTTVANGEQHYRPTTTTPAVTLDKNRVVEKAVHTTKQQYKTAFGQKTGHIQSAKPVETLGTMITSEGKRRRNRRGET